MSSRSSGRAADWLGRQATDADFDRVLRGREIITDDDGVAIAYLPGVLSGDASDAAVVAFGDLADVEAPSLTRRQAAGPLDLDRLREIRPDVVAVDAVSPTSGHLVLADGRTLRQVVCNPVRSYLAGWSVGRFDGPTRMKHALRVASAEPLLAELDMALSSAPTERGRMIGTIGGHGLEGTPFSTLTINVDYESRYHLDRGDFRGGLCALAAFAIAPYTGGLVVFPRRRIAVDLAPGRDVLLFRAHEEIHGNTAVSRLTPARWGRLSIVAYLKDKLANVTDAR